jgi:uncharacterized protein YjbI with pentapeptide repeats
MTRKKQVYTPSIEPSYSKKAIWSWLGLVVAAIGVVQIQEIVRVFNEAVTGESSLQLPRLARQDTNDPGAEATDRGETPPAPTETAIAQDAPPQSLPEPIQPIEFSQESQQAILDNYQNLLHAFVVEENLKELSADAPLRIAANERTIATLHQLEGSYRERLLQFLIDSNLIQGESPTISLRGASFSDADLSDVALPNFDLQGARFVDAGLNRSNLSGARLVEVAFDGADLSFADLNGAALDGSSLQRANLFLANISNTSLQGANLIASDGFLANFQGANLSNANAATADLSFANLSQAQLVFTNFSDANLSFINLSQARLTGADFSRSLLRGADLSNADLGGANFRNADLSGVNLSGANLIGANLTGAVFYNTTMPDGSIRN